MKYEDIIKEIKNKKYHPIYFLSGEESYYIDVISNYLEKEVLEDDQKDFNLNVMYGRDVDCAEIVTAAKRFPMMSDTQVVVVKEAQNVKSFDNLKTYIENPLKSTVLVICYKHKKLDKRTAWGKLISSSSNVAFLETKKLYENQLPEWIVKYCKSQGYEIEAKASFLLVESVGADLSRLHNELDKLFLNVKKGDKINADAIEKYIGISKDYNVFELTNAIGKRDIVKINKIVNYFVANSKDASIYIVIGVVLNYFTALLSYTFIKEKNDKFTLAKKMGVSPYFVADYIAASKIYNPRKVVENISVLREFDMKTKGVGVSGVSRGELLKEMMYKITH